MARLVRMLCALTCIGCGRLAFEPRDAGGTSTSDATTDASLVCPTGYTAMGSSCYRFVINPPVELTWLDAERACEADGPGAHLIVIDDGAEQLLAFTGLGVSSDAWIGVSDLLVEGSYQTVTGDPFAVPAWSAGEPNGDLQDCLRVMNTGAYGDRTCTEVNDYICEADGRDAVTP